MDTTTTPLAAESAMPHPRVRADLAAGTILLALVIGGNVLRHASDTGILSAFGTH